MWTYSVVQYKAKTNAQYIGIIKRPGIKRL